MAGPLRAYQLRPRRPVCPQRRTLLPGLLFLPISWIVESVASQFIARAPAVCWVPVRVIILVERSEQDILKPVPLFGSGFPAAWIWELQCTSDGTHSQVRNDGSTSNRWAKRENQLSRLSPDSTFYLVLCWQSQRNSNPCPNLESTQRGPWPMRRHRLMSVIGIAL